MSDLSMKELRQTCLLFHTSQVTGWNKEGDARKIGGNHIYLHQLQHTTSATDAISRAKPSFLPCLNLEIIT